MQNSHTMRMSNEREIDNKKKRSDFELRTFELYKNKQKEKTKTGEIQSSWCWRSTFFFISWQRPFWNLYPGCDHQFHQLLHPIFWQMWFYVEMKLKKKHNKTNTQKWAQLREKLSQGTWSKSQPVVAGLRPSPIWDVIRWWAVRTRLQSKDAI